MGILKTEDMEVQCTGSIIEAGKIIGIPFGCEQGKCGLCRIEIIEGTENLGELTSKEKEMDCNTTRRLACQCKMKEGVTKIKFTNIYGTS